MLKASSGYVDNQIEMAEAFEEKAVKDIFCFEDMVFRANELPQIEGRCANKIGQLRNVRGNASLLRPKFVVVNGQRFKVKQSF